MFAVSGFEAGRRDREIHRLDWHESSSRQSRRQQMRESGFHHHFGRQCRVADYGFTKMIDLLEALTHTVQVMGEGNKRTVTLSHRAQIRRFTSDLLRVLEAQANKQITLSELPNVYARVIGKPWDVVDYGVCEIGDILSEVSENTFVVTTYNGDDKLIAIPKR